MKIAVENYFPFPYEIIDFPRLIVIDFHFGFEKVVLKHPVFDVFCP